MRSKRLRQPAKNLSFTTWFGESRLQPWGLGMLEQQPQATQVRGATMCWMLKKQRERAAALDNSNIFFFCKTEGEAGLRTQQRGIQFSWCLTLNTIWCHQTMKEKKQQAKPSSNFCHRDCCKVLFCDCLPQKSVLGVRHLFFTLLVKWQQAGGHFYLLQFFSSHADRLPRWEK